MNHRGAPRSPYVALAFALAALSGACGSSSPGTGAAGHGGGAGHGGSGGSGGGGATGSQTVGPSGGGITLAGVGVAIPEGALSTSTAISVSMTTAPSGYTLASAAYQFGPDGTTFAKPVTVTIPLTAATPGAHLFWSNDAGGFDDVGGTVQGTLLIGQVTHFSVGFCAVPSRDGGVIDGATDAATDAATDVAASDDGGAGADGGSTDAPKPDATTGDAPAGDTNTADVFPGDTNTSDAFAGDTNTADVFPGDTNTSDGAGGDAASTDAVSGDGGASSDATSSDSGSTSDGSTFDAASLCVGGLNAPVATVTNDTTGTLPAPGTFTGGALRSGNYFFTAVTHYSAATTYGGSTREWWVVDANAQTVKIATSTGMIGIVYSNAAANELHGDVVCNTTQTAVSTFDWYYTLGATLVLNLAGSPDVRTFSAPAVP